MATEAQALPEKIRQTFEEFGVIKRIAVPKLDLLDKAIKDRKGRWEIQIRSDGIAVASVTMHGQKFDGAADESNLALSVAFASALLGTQPRQGGLFDPFNGDSIDSISITRDGVTDTFQNPRTKPDVDLDPDVTPMASGLNPDPAPELVVEQTLRAAGIPVRYDADSGLYRNPLGDAYPERWAEQEASIQARRIGFVGSRG